MFVEDVMTRRPPLCFRGQQLVTAARVIHQSGLVGVPVLDLRFQLVGVLSLEDLVRWEARRSESRRWLRAIEQPALVAHAMTHEIVSVSMRESVSDAARVMRFVERSTLPVLDDDGSLAGMISAREIAAAVGRSDTTIRADVVDLLSQRSSTSAPGSINVHVEDGRVTLTGAIGSPRGLTRLQRSIAAIAGVIGIETEMVAAVPADAD
jgi:predicted transcriptional regulator